MNQDPITNALWKARSNIKYRKLKRMFKPTADMWFNKKDLEHRGKKIEKLHKGIEIKEKELELIKEKRRSITIDTFNGKNVFDVSKNNQLDKTINQLEMELENLKILYENEKLRYDFLRLIVLGETDALDNPVLTDALDKIAEEESIEEIDNSNNQTNAQGSNGVNAPSQTTGAQVTTPTNGQVSVTSKNPSTPTSAPQGVIPPSAPTKLSIVTPPPVTGPTATTKTIKPNYLKLIASGKVAEFLNNSENGYLVIKRRERTARTRKFMGEVDVASGFGIMVLATLFLYNTANYESQDFASAYHSFVREGPLDFAGTIVNDMIQTFNQDQGLEAIIEKYSPGTALFLLGAATTAVGLRTYFRSKKEYDKEHTSRINMEKYNAVTMAATTEHIAKKI